MVSQLSTPNNSPQQAAQCILVLALCHTSALCDTCGTSFPSIFLPVTPGSRCRRRNKAVPNTGPQDGGPGKLGVGPEETLTAEVSGGQEAPVSPSSGVGDAALSAQKWPAWQGPLGVGGPGGERSCTGAELGPGRFIMRRSWSFRQVGSRSVRL